MNELLVGEVVKAFHNFYSFFGLGLSLDLTNKREKLRRSLYDRHLTVYHFIGYWNCESIEKK